jgi:hypothetical protein
MSLPISTMWPMGEVVDIRVWRARVAAAASHPSALAKVAAGSTDRSAATRDEPEAEDAAGEGAHQVPTDAALDMLERAVGRLHPLVSDELRRRRPLEREVETELLAIMGELSVGLIHEATRRAERLADRLRDAGSG